MIRLTAIALLSFALGSLGVVSARTFVIEAEDFDHDAGQHPPIVDEMPYYGGAMGQYSAISGIDYDFPDSRPTPDMYRYYETPNVPIRGAWSTLSRGAWDVVENFRLSRFTPSSGAWFNYTRVIPAGRYRVYAALSWGDNTPNAVGGQFALVTSGLGTPNQTLAPLGNFLGDGSGNWEAIRRVPLREGGLPKVVDLDGTSVLTAK